MTLIGKPRGGLWTQAAVYGALWGALEITLGALLHAARVPLLGLFMAAGQAAFLVAIHQIHPRRGLALATSVVAALVRGISPTGAILSPLIAILAQGALVEACLSLIPARRLSALLAGGLAPFWALAQMLLMHLLIFGRPILTLYAKILTGITRAAGFAPDTAWGGAALPAALLFTLGAGAALWGRRLGILAATRLQATAPESPTPEQQPSRRTHAQGGPPPTGGLIVLPICALVVFLQIPARLPFVATSAALAVGTLAWTQPRAARRLYLSRFFGITVLVAALTGSLLARSTHHLGPLPVSLAGTRLAALVLLRATALLAVGALVGRQLTAERISRWTSGPVLRPVGIALARALVLVPTFLSASRPAPDGHPRRPWYRTRGDRIVALLSLAASLAAGEEGANPSPMAAPGLPGVRLEQEASR